jgi:hypothetical protein
MSRIVRSRPISVIAPAVLLAALLAPCGSVFAVQREDYTMEILVGGTPLQEYAARGTSYIEALKGREYSIRLCNRTGERVAIALSVDGLNSIDARTTSAVEGAKWILEPYGSITLDGWQTSAATARRFVFTTEDRSYGAWLGKTKNLGLVAAAVFREKRPRPIVYEDDERRKDSEEESLQGTAGAGPAPEARGQKSAQPKPSGDLAATGIGRQVDHQVHEVSFDAEDAPSALLEIRYEYRDALVRLGVVPPDRPCDAPLSRRESARGFDGPRFAPDPYGPRHHR